MLAYSFTPAPQDAEFRAEAVLGRTAPVPSSRVDLGRPQHRRIDPAQVAANAAMHGALSLLDDADFYVLYVSCTLSSRKGELIRSASYSVDLSTDSGAPATVWDIAPEVLTRSVHVVQGPTSSEAAFSVGIGEGLKIGPTLKRTDGSTREFEAQEWYVRGTGAGTGTGQWEYRRLPDDPSIDRDHSMVFVARVPRGDGLRLESDLTASIELPGGGIGRFFAQLLGRRHDAEKADEPLTYRIDPPASSAVVGPA